MFSFTFIPDYPGFFNNAATLLENRDKFIISVTLKNGRRFGGVTNFTVYGTRKGNSRVLMISFYVKDVGYVTYERGDVLKIDAAFK